MVSPHMQLADHDGVWIRRDNQGSGDHIFCSAGQSVIWQWIFGAWKEEQRRRRKYAQWVLQLSIWRAKGGGIAWAVISRAAAKLFWFVIAAISKSSNSVPGQRVVSNRRRHTAMHHGVRPYYAEGLCDGCIERMLRGNDKMDDIRFYSFRQVFPLFCLFLCTIRWTRLKGIC